MKIKTALISVSDKNKLYHILKKLRKYKIKLISSGGTYKKISIDWVMNVLKYQIIQVFQKFWMEELKPSSQNTLQNIV